MIQLNRAITRSSIQFDTIHKYINSDTLSSTNAALNTHIIQQLFHSTTTTFPDPPTASNPLHKRWSYHPRPSQHYKLIDKMIRVDHAGEYGAQSIYAGQLSALHSSPQYDTINTMKLQEIEHLQRLNRLIVERRVRPTLLMPIWNIGGYMMGYISGMLGSSSAMACTVAVEDVITSHYNDQLRECNELSIDDTDIKSMIKKHRDDEESHSQIGIDNQAKSAPLYEVQNNTITYMTKAAVQVAQII